MSSWRIRERWDVDGCGEIGHWSAESPAQSKKCRVSRILFEASCDRGIGAVAVALNNFESYLFLDRPLRGHYALALGNLSRFATAEAEVITHYDAGERRTETVRLVPKAHAEVALAFIPNGRGIRVDMSCNGRRESVDVTLPVAKR